MEKQICVEIEKGNKQDKIYQKKLQKKKEIEELLKQIEKDSKIKASPRCNLGNLFTVLCLLALLICFLIIF